jgi:alpha-galactosidase
VDNCGGTRYPTANASWINFRKGIDGCAAAGGRRMALSVEYCRGGDSCADWVAGLVDLWRCSGDIQANWLSLLSNLDAANANAVAQRPGHYNDPDMLLIGQPGISLLEAQSQLGAWAVVAAPLLLSLDLTQPQPPELLALLLNAEALAVSQDAGRVQGVRVSAANASGTECWARPLAAGAAAGTTPPLAVLLLNRGGAPSGASCTWAELGIPAGATAAVRDLWAGRDLPPAAGAVSVASLPPHGSALLRVVAQA